MKAVSPELAAAIEAPERAVRAKVSVDWDGDGHGGTGTIDDLSPRVGAIKLDQALTTETPDPVRVVEGSASRSATLNLDRGGILSPAGSAVYRDSGPNVTNGTASFVTKLPLPSVRAGDYLLAHVSVAHGRPVLQARPSWDILGVARSGLLDTFDRAVSGGWGSPTEGPPWTLGGAGSASDASVANGVGVISHSSTATAREQRCTGVQMADGSIVATVTISALPLSQGVAVTVLGRDIDASNRYHADVFFTPSNTALVRIEKTVAGVSSNLVTSSAVPGLTSASRVRLELRMAGTSLKARAWEAGTAPPTGWHAEVTDASLSARGGVACRSRINSGNTNTFPLVATFADVHAIADDGMVSYLYGRWATELDADPPDGYIYRWDWQPDTPAAAVAGLMAIGGQVQHQPGTLGPVAWGITHETVSGTAHTTPTIATTVDGCRLASFFAFRAGASGSWTPPSGQTERTDIISTHGSVNIAHETNSSTNTVAAGSHTLTATASASSPIATMAIVALAPVEAGDERLHAARHFSRHNPASPLVGKERQRRPATIDVEFLTAAGWQGVRRMTGLTRRLRTSSARRTATLELLDYRERLRTPVTLIPTIGEVSGADGTWVVFQALAANDIYAGPAPRAEGSLLWMPMYGSLNAVSPERDPAWVASVIGPGSSRFRPTFGPGPFVSAPTGLYHRSDSDFRRIFSGITRDLAWDGMTGRLEMWVLGVASPTTATAGSKGRTYILFTDGIAIQPLPRVGVRHNGKLFFDTFDSSDSPIDAYESTAVVPSDGQWHFVGIHWDFVAQEITFRIDSADETVATTVAGGDIPTGIDLIQFTSWAAVSDVHLHGPLDAAEPWLSETLQIEAHIDQSTLQLVAVYDTGPFESWDLTHEVAGAEQAVAYWDEDGAFQYRTRRRLVTPEAQTVQRNLTAERSLVDLADDDAVDSVRNVVQVSFAPVTDPGLVEFVTDDTQTRVLAPRSTLDVEISFSDPVVQLLTTAFPTTVLLHEVTSPVVDPYIVLTLNEDGTDNPNTGDLLDRVTATVVDWSPRSALLRIRSTAAVVLYVVAIGLRGRRVLVGNTVLIEARDQQSIARYGEQPLAITASQWVQTRSQATTIAYSILGDTKAPAPVITNLGIVADPRLQLGDRVRIQDRHGINLDREYWITGIPDEGIGSGDGYRQSISARPAARQFVVGTGLIGIDLIGGE